MDFLIELLITALLSVLLAFLLGKLFSFDHNETDQQNLSPGDDGESADLPTGQSIVADEKKIGAEAAGFVAECSGEETIFTASTDEIEIESVVAEAEHGFGYADKLLEVLPENMATGKDEIEKVDGGGELECADSRELEIVGIRLEEVGSAVEMSGVVGLEIIDSSLLGEEEIPQRINIDLAKKGLIDEVIEVRSGEECAQGMPSSIASERIDTELLQVEAVESELERKSELGNKSQLPIRQILEVVQVETGTINDRLVKEELENEQESIEEVEASQGGPERQVNEVRLEHDLDKEMHVPEDVNFLGEEEEVRSGKVAALETGIGDMGLEKRSQVTGAEHSSTSNDEERLEKLGIAEEKNVGSTEDEMVSEDGCEGKIKEEMSSVVVREQSFLNEEDEWEGIEKTEMETLFSKAAAYVGSESGEGELSKLSGDDQLQLYGLYKVATEGPCYDSQPMALKVSSRAKWNAWQRLGSMNPEGAMEQYMELLSEKIPRWKGKKTEGESKHEETCSLQKAESEERKPIVCLNLSSQLNSETERKPEDPSCSSKENMPDDSEYLDEGVSGED